MKISFKEINDGLANEVFVDDTYIGIVSKNIWDGKWTIKPDFNYYNTRISVKNTKYNSFYKAGKAMVELYNYTFSEYEDYDDTDTHEFDMRGIFKQRGP